MEDHRLPESAPSDEALVARVCERDTAAFAALYDRHAPAVYALAAHVLGDSEAEEIVQEVFLRVWNKADRFQPARGSFRVWLMSIARHRTLDELRRRDRQRHVEVAEEVDLLLAGAADRVAGVEDLASASERDRAMLRSLGRLPAEQRRVLVLAYFGGLSQTAMADQLGWPLGTVKKRLRLGLQKLRAAMAGQGFLPDPRARKG